MRLSKHPFFEQVGRPFTRAHHSKRPAGGCRLTGQEGERIYIIQYTPTYSTTSTTVNITQATLSINLWDREWVSAAFVKLYSSINILLFRNWPLGTLPVRPSHLLAWSTEYTFASTPGPFLMIESVLDFPVRTQTDAYLDSWTIDRLNTRDVVKIKKTA